MYSDERKEEVPSDQSVCFFRDVSSMLLLSPEEEEEEEEEGQGKFSSSCQRSCKRRITAVSFCLP